MSDDIKTTALAHAVARGRGTAADIVVDARTFEEYLTGPDVADGAVTDGAVTALVSVFLLTSPTYVREHAVAPFDTDVVGVFGSREAAEEYKTRATPPVVDGKVVEWAVQ